MLYISVLNILGSSLPSQKKYFFKNALLDVGQTLLFFAKNGCNEFKSVTRGSKGVLSALQVSEHLKKQNPDQIGK